MREIPKCRRFCFLFFCILSEKKFISVGLKLLSTIICLFFKDCELTVQCALHITHCTVVQLDHRFLRFPTFTVCGRRAQRHLRLHRLSALCHVHSLVPFETCGEMKQKVNILRSQLLSAPPICLQSYTLCLVCTSTAHFVHLSICPLVCGHCAPL